MICNEPECNFFMFINCSSGNGIGQALVEQQIKKIEFQFPMGNQTKLYNVYFFNMRTQIHEGFKLLQNMVNGEKKVIGVICGGDGTVMWVVNTLAAYKIYPSAVPLTIIPLGTGNDFSQNLNWGKEQKTLTENSFKELKYLMKNWLAAKVEDLDIWNVHISTYPHGYFEKAQDSKDVKLNDSTIEKDFCNYFSFGIDGKIGYEFDKNRTKSRMGNLAMYGVMGIKQGIGKINTIEDLVQLIKVNGKQIIIDKVPTMKSQFTNLIEGNFNKIAQQIKGPTLHQNQNLLALNINSYMGGVKNIWVNGRQNSKLRDTFQQSQPSHSDNKLQFVSFSSNVTIGLEKALSAFSETGFAEKQFQGQGIVEIIFKQYPNQEHRTYIQIDGQFFRVTHPAKICIRKSSNISNGKIKVLHKLF